MHILSQMALYLTLLILLFLIWKFEKMLVSILENVEFC